ncbi:bifunctional DNA primase/polymerase [Hyphomonas sp.]|uniref:bifunctional DNA primase/polymerase n=1 Tax=Hyphomonas sp. TaxID=87 RepID=UPI0030FA871B
MCANEKSSFTIEAEKLTNEGLIVFPARETGRPKTPHVLWTNEATRDKETIRGWGSKWPNALVAVPTGRQNGIIVLDVDLKHGVDGFESLRALGINPDTFEGKKVITPTGGLHLYYGYREGIKNSVGKLGPGLDVRSDGGYVIAAGHIPGVGSYEAAK